MIDISEKLARAYELTYKYGWILSVQRRSGYLDDKANVYKMQLEGELDPLIKYLTETIQTELFQHYLDNETPETSKHSTIARIQRMSDRLKNQSGSLSDRIVLFQEALNTAHNTGPMSDYLSNVGVTPWYLTDLSSDTNVTRWDDELEKIFGKKPMMYFED